MGVKIFQVDAFTSEPFRGNPAAVCLLDSSRDETWMQRVAAEMNLSETAFPVPKEGSFDLRWFTPTIEVPLCGHATLATSHILWETKRLEADEPANFHTKSGRLVAKKTSDGIEMNLPSIPQSESEPPERLLKALGIEPIYCGATEERPQGDRDFLLVVHSERVVRDLEPNFGLLKEVPAGVMVTARSETASCDFVSRYFVPYWGIDEDPVTGAAHCTLIPFWSQKLGRPEVMGYQASRRGGYVKGRVVGDRVALVGKAVTVLRGELVA
jgi:PhzF family phenazine biosynthesis protein